jgi:ubiquinone/menaquinone biosynthesis C-methylase UbiE
MDWDTRYSQKIGIPEFPFSRTVAQLKHVSDIQNSLKSNKQLVLLDLGCGNGIHYSVAKHYNYRYVGIDLSPIAVSMTENRIMNTMNNEYYDSVFQMNLTDLTFPDGHFDVVMERHAIDQLRSDHAKNAMNEITRVLRDNGFFIGMFAVEIGHQKISNFRSFWPVIELTELLKNFEILVMHEGKETDLIKNKLEVIEIGVIAKKK